MFMAVFVTEACEAC